MNHRTTITLSRKAFSHNIAKINALTGDDSCAIVIKSNAYGHGICEMAHMAEREPGVSWICTAGISEALPLRKQGIAKPLLVLSYLDGDLQEAVRQNIHLSVTSFEEAVAISVEAERIATRGYLHVKIDTGMGRMGLLPHEALLQIQRMKQLPFVTIYGVFTHLSDTGHTDTSYCEKQLEIFDGILDEIAAAGITLACTHAQSSSSLNFAPRRHYSFIRAGASIYGLLKSSAQKTVIQKRDPSFDLIPVLEWRVRITQLKQLPSGSSVGYSRTFTTNRQTVLALVPIGYWDGYPFALSNKGVAYANGYIVPVVGIVSMNIAAFDVTDIPDIRVGDEVILLGDAPSIRPHDLAKQADIITNEVTTHINSSLPRTVVDEHVPLIHTSTQKKDAIKNSLV